MKVAVLGRGKSLEQYADCYTEFDTLYIVNAFRQEIATLGLHKFLGKKITHVVGRQVLNSLNVELYEALGIDTIQSNCFNMKNFVHEKKFAIEALPLPKCMQDRGYPTLPWDLIFEFAQKYTKEGNKESLCRMLDNVYSHIIQKAHKKLVPTRIWPTAGMLAVDLALTENTLDEIHLFGFDFYNNDYLVKKKLPHQNPEWVKVKMMKYHLAQLKKEYSDVNFVFAKA